MVLEQRKTQRKDQGMGFLVLAAQEMKWEPKNVLPALLLGHYFFVQSLTLVLRSLLLNCTDMLAMPASTVKAFKD